jgi:FlaA1/EpsC-like NDP-sugar epimerase
MVKLSGLKPVEVHPGQPSDYENEGDIQITISQLRPGGKLYEKMLIEEHAKPTIHPRILTSDAIAMPWTELGTVLDRHVFVRDAIRLRIACATTKRTDRTYTQRQGSRSFVRHMWSITRFR